MSQADGDSDMAPLLCGKGLNKGTMASASTSVGEKAAPPALALKQNNSVPPLYVPGMGLEEEPPRTPEALRLTQSQSPLIFTARSYGDFSSWHWKPGLGGTGVGLGPFVPQGGLL